MKCFVPGCTSDFHRNKYHGTGQPESFSKHRFPIDLKRRTAWLESLANTENKQRVYNLDEINFNNVRVCSKHFLDTDFYYKNGKRILCTTAIPVVFTNRCGPETESQLNEIEFVDIGGNQQVSSTLNQEGGLRDPPPPAPTRKRTIRYAGDIKNTNITPKEALTILPKILTQLSRSQKRVKLLRRQNKRLRDRLESIQEMYEHHCNEELAVLCEPCDVTGPGLISGVGARFSGQVCSDAVRSVAKNIKVEDPSGGESILDSAK